MMKALFLLALFTSSAYSHTQHAVHAHGFGQMNIVQDGDSVMIELTLTAADTVGFEHMPENKEQLEAIKKAQIRLTNFDSLFDYDGVCKVIDVNVESPLFAKDDVHYNHESKDKDNAHHAHNKHDHNKHDHKQHQHDHDHEGEHHDSHSDIIAEYTLTCSSPITMLTVNLFNHFSGLELLDVAAITSNGQLSEQLSKNNKTLKF